MMNDYTLGPDGTQIRHYFESLVLKAYPDPGSPRAKALQTGRAPAAAATLSGVPWTIGWGDTGPDVVEGLTITAEEADARFARRMAAEFEPGVRDMLEVDVTQRQFDALGSIGYNIGLEALRTSTLMRKLNAGDVAGAAAEFPRWNKSGGVVMKGLQRAREAERLVFLDMDAKNAITAALARFP
jgi:lysozyme